MYIYLRFKYSVMKDCKVDLERYIKILYAASRSAYDKRFDLINMPVRYRISYKFRNSSRIV